jgi:hypothetical protein
MTGTASDTIPTMWDQAWDGAFFRMMVGLFDTGFCFGASVLLASYDDECVAPASWTVRDSKQNPLPSGSTRTTQVASGG